MRTTILGSESRRPATQPRPRGPGIDGFGASISVVVLAATAAAALVVRQNLDDHVYRLAANAAQVDTTGAAASR